jgi:hypothetical protein
MSAPGFSIVFTERADGNGIDIQRGDEVVTLRMSFAELMHPKKVQVELLGQAIRVLVLNVASKR